MMRQEVRNNILKLSVRWQRQPAEELAATGSWTTPYPGLRWKRIAWPGFATAPIVCECEPGLDFPYHMHPGHDEILTVLSGYVRLEIVKNVHVLQAGQAQVIPAGVLHRGVYPEGARILLSFNPKVGK